MFCVIVLLTLVLQAQSRLSRVCFMHERRRRNSKFDALLEKLPFARCNPLSDMSLPASLVCALLCGSQKNQKPTFYTSPRPTVPSTGPRP